MAQLATTSAQRESPAHAAELERLHALYASYREERTRGRVIVIHGPRGHWSESLLNDFKRHVVSRREPYFEAACEGSTGRTYGPVRELLSQYMNHLEVLGLVDEPLARRFSEVGAFLGLGSGLMSQPIERVAPEAAMRGQIHFYEQLGELLQECSERCPAVLGLRDLHLADSTTRAAVRFIIEHYAIDTIDPFAPADVARRRFRGFFAVTTQDDETSSVLRTLREGSAGNNVEFVSLAGVDLETVRRFLQEPQVIQRFLDSSAGNPENLRALVDALPEGVDDLLARRLHTLDEDSRRLLDVLAVYDRPAAPEFLVRLSGVPAGAFADLVSGLMSGHFVVQRIRRGHFQIQLESQHAQRTIYELMDRTLRTELHGAVGSLLEEQHKLGQNVDLEELAHHFLHSADRRQGIDFALAAAERLHMTFGYQRAAEFLTSALSLLETDDPRRESVLARLIDLHTSLNEFQRALFFCGKLKASKPVTERGDVYRRSGRVLLEMGRYRLALRVLECARTLAEARTDGPTLLRIFAATAEAHYGLGQHDEARALHEAALELVDDDSPATRRELVSLVNTAGKIELARKDFDAAQTLFEDNIATADRFSWPDERVRALFNCGIVALLRSDYTAAERVFTECLSYGHTTANPTTRAFCLLNLAVIDHKTLRWDRALEYYLHSLATFRSSSSFFQFVATALNLAELYLELGDRIRAGALTTAAREVLEAHEIHHYRAWMLKLVGRVELANDNLDAALAAFGESRRVAVAKNWTKRRELFVDMALLFLRRGDIESAEVFLARDEGEFETTESRAGASRMRAVIAWTRGELERAAELLDETIDLLESEGDLHPMWEVIGERALLDFAMGESSSGRARLNVARETISSLVRNVPESLRSRFTSKRAAMRLFAAIEAVENGQNPLDVALPRLISEARSTAVAPTSRPHPAVAPAIDDSLRSRFSRIIGDDPRLHSVFERVDRIAASRSTVLVLGESGTGKELLADALHRLSDRGAGPFVKVNCGAFVETLLLSELFGHEKGAFTGAMSRKIGRFEQADCGTLFLDEIGDISPNTQVALLRVLQEGTFERVGGSQTQQVDVRVVCATNHNLEQLVKAGQFRLDLYYRLKGVVLELPPLRQRLGDIPILVDHFLAQVAESGAPKRVSRGALRRLMCYSWPGNIRELQNFVRSIALFVPGAIIESEHIEQFRDFFSDGEVRDADTEIDASLDAAMERSLERALDAPLATADLPCVEDVVEAFDDAPPSTPGSAADGHDAMIAHVLNGDVALADLKRQLELECIRRALIETEGNITHAASLLQMKRPRLSQIINANDELRELRSKAR